MNKLKLNNQNLTKLTEFDLISFCELNNIKPEELGILNLYRNELIDLDFITENTPFINLKQLYIGNNLITDINNVKYLINLEELSICNNKITNIDILINLLNLELLDISDLNLNENKIFSIIKKLNKLTHLICYNMFKNYTYNDLNKIFTNIEIIR